MKTEKSTIPKTPRLGIAVSLKAAGAVTGLSYRAVQMAKSAGCPAFRQNGRVNCDALLRWLGENPDVLEAAGESVNRDVEITLKTKAEREIREHRLALLRGEYVRTKDVEIWVGEMISNAKKVLNAGPSSLAPQVVGVTIPEAEKLLRQWLHDSLALLSKNPGGAE